MEMVNGYVFLDLTKSNVYAKALKVLGADKPVVIKEGVGAPYFVDSIALVGTSVVITKGAKTITIANNNTITNVGDIQPLMENIFDKDGNLRFIEGDGEITEPTGVTITYNKWSLSGTHLMCVLAGSVADTTVLSDLITTYDVPKWVWDKIYPVWLDNIEIKSTNLVNDDYSAQAISFRIAKGTAEGRIYIRQSGGSVTLTKDRSFRIQFDLLIDNE